MVALQENSSSKVAVFSLTVEKYSLRLLGHAYTGPVEAYDALLCTHAEDVSS